MAVIPAEALHSIPSCSNFYLDTEVSIWDKDARELAGRLTESGMTIDGIFEDHHRNRKTDDKPRTIYVPSVALGGSYKHRVPLPPLEVVTFSRLPYGAKLGEGDTRTKLQIEGEGVRVTLKEGMYEEDHSTGVRRYERVKESGVTVLIDTFGSLDGRSERRQRVEEIVRDFYSK